MDCTALDIAMKCSHAFFCRAYDVLPCVTTKCHDVIRIIYVSQLHACCDDYDEKERTMTTIITALEEREGQREAREEKEEEEEEDEMEKKKNCDGTNRSDQKPVTRSLRLHIKI